MILGRPTITSDDYLELRRLLGDAAGALPANQAGQWNQLLHEHAERLFDLLCRQLIPAEWETVLELKEMLVNRKEKQSPATHQVAKFLLYLVFLPDHVSKTGTIAESLGLSKPTIETIAKYVQQNASSLLVKGGSKHSGFAWTFPQELILPD